MSDNIKCQMDNCSEIKCYDKNYCEKHSCHYDNCNDVATERHIYCERHNDGICMYAGPCIAGGCGKVRRCYSSFCDMHMCKYSDCVNGREFGGYCKEHNY